jgi:hypothetical protein
VGSFQAALDCPWASRVSILEVAREKNTIEKANAFRQLMSFSVSKVIFFSEKLALHERFGFDTSKSSPSFSEMYF